MSKWGFECSTMGWFLINTLQRHISTAASYWLKVGKSAAEITGSKRGSPGCAVDAMHYLLWYEPDHVGCFFPYAKLIPLLFHIRKTPASLERLDYRGSPPIIHCPSFRQISHCPFPACCRKLGLVRYALDP